MVFESIQDKRPSRLSQWISKSGDLALGCLALFQGQTRSKVLEQLILREEGTLRKQDDKL